MWWRRTFGNRSKSRSLPKVASSTRTARGGRRPLQLEALEERTLLDVGGLLQADTFAGVVGSSSVTVDAEVRDLISAITTTGSTQPVCVAGEAVGAGDGAVFPATSETTSQINLDAFRADSRFAGIDGTGFAAVILDTGIDVDHPFFGPDGDSDGIADRIVYQYDFADRDGDASDVDGHGSNVTSIVASQNATYPGMAPGVDIIHLKVFEDDGDSYFAYIEDALQWVVANAASYNVASVNMSLEDGLNHSTAKTLYGIDDELATLKAMGVVVVSASGNGFYSHSSAQGVAYPAADPSSLSVGAVYDGDTGGWVYTDGAEAYTTDVDRIAPFSQRHETLTTVMAPGAVITGASATGGTLDGHGTSQAAPHVSGIAVLAQQLAVQEMGRRLTQDEFANLLQTTGVTVNDGDDEDDNVTNTGLEFPRVDVWALGDAIYSMAHLEIDADDDPGGDNVADDGDADEFLIQLNAAGTDVEVYINGDLFTTAPLADLNTIAINGSGDDDTVIVDFSNGDPIPASPDALTFHGGSGSDTLTVTGGAGFTDVVYDAEASGSGALTLDGSPITFTGLEPLQVLPVAGTITINIDPGNTHAGPLTSTFNSPGAVLGLDNEVTFSAGGLESLEFNNPTAALIVNGDGADDDLIQFNSLHANFDAAITVDGQGGADRIDLNTPLSLGAGSTGNVSLTAGDIRFTETLSTTGAAVLEALTGRIEGDGGDSDTDLVASTAVLRAADGIALQTEVDNLEADGGAGGVFIDELDDLTIGGISGLEGIAGNAIGVFTPGNLTISERVVNPTGTDYTELGGFDVTIDSPILTHGSSTSIDADNRLELHSAIDTDGGWLDLWAMNDDLLIDGTILTGGGDLYVYVSKDVELTSSALVDAELGNPIIGAPYFEFRAFGGMTMADGSVVNARDGEINVSVDNDVVIGRLVGEWYVFVNTNAGSIGDGGDSGGADITSDVADLWIGGSIGAALDPIEVEANYILAVALGGGIYLDNVGPVTLGDPWRPIEAAGDVEISSTGSMIVDGDVVAGGSVTLTAIDSVGSGNDLTINAGVTVQASGSAVTLRGGDDIELQPGSTVDAAGRISLEGDFGDVDPGTGSTMDVLGTLNAVTGADVLGGADEDAIRVSPSSTTSITIDGGAPGLAAFPGGDELTVDVTGIPVADFTTTTTGPGAGIVQVNGMAPITYADVERFGAIGGLIDVVVTSDADPGGDNVADDGQADEFLIQLNAAGTDVEVYINGDLVTMVPLADLNTITFNGSGDDDTVIVDCSNGLPIPAGGISFDGAGEMAADALVIQGNAGAHASSTETYTYTGPDSGSIDLDGRAITYTGLEPITNTGTPTDIIFHLPSVVNDAFLEDDGDWTNGMSRLRSGNGAFELTTFANPSGSLTINGADQADTFTVTRLDNGYAAAAYLNGLDDNDTLVVDFSQGLVEETIEFDGGVGHVDRLELVGDPPTGIARTTYRAGVAADAGDYTVDPDGNMDAGLAVAANGDELVVHFTGLERIDDVVPADQLDGFLTAGPDDVRVADGGTVATFQTTEIRDQAGTPTFETVRFANKTTVTVNGLDGADTMVVDNPNAATGLSQLLVLGNELTDGALNPDDNAADQLNVDGTGATVVTWAIGQRGDDVLRVGSTGTLDNILGPVVIDGSVGGETVGDTAHVLDQNGTAQDPTITLTVNSITGAAAGAIFYANVVGLTLNTTDHFATTLDVLGTWPGAATSIDMTTGTAVATATVGNTTASFGDGAGNLDDILGALTFDFNDGAGTLQVDDTGDTTGDLAASISDNGTFTSIVGLSPQMIAYRTDSPNRLDDLIVLAGSGGNTIDVVDTTATGSTRVDSGTGDDSNTVTINADGLTGDNTFTGNTGNDRFVLNVTADVGGASLLVEGNDPAGDPANRDVLEINDLGATARNLTFGYPTTVNGDSTVSGFAIPVNVRSMETVAYDGDAGNDDTVLVAATPSADDLMVTPTGAHSADVMIDGGVGASLGPDLSLSGLDATTGLMIDGNLPVFPGSPGNRDVLDHNGGPVATLMVLGPGAGKIIEAGSVDVNYLSIEEVQSALPMTVVVTADADPGPNGSNDGVADDFLIQLDASGTNLQVFVNGTLVFSNLALSVLGLTIGGSGDDDTLVVDNANGLVSLPGGIVFDAGIGVNSLTVQGDPGAAIAREWYITGPSVPAAAPLFGPYSESDGVLMFDPNDSVATHGGVAGLDGDEQVIVFFGLTPVYDTTPAARLDVLLTPNADLVDVVDGPGITGTTYTTEINDRGTGALESIEFANKSVVTVNGFDGADAIALRNPNAADGLTRLELYGNEFTDGLLNADDGAGDRFDVEATDAGVPVGVYGQGGNDLFDLENAGDVDDILGAVTVDGGAGDDDLVVDDTGSAGGVEVVTLRATTISGITGSGGGGGLITYQGLGAGTVTISSNGAGHAYFVESTAPGLAQTVLNTGGGSDEITIDDGAGTANGVVSPIDLNTQGGDNDMLWIEDGADAAANTFHMDATRIGGGAFGAAVSPGGIFGAGGLLAYDGDLERLLVIGPDGSGLDNTFNVEGTGVGVASGVGSVELVDGEGSAVFHVRGEQLAPAAGHVFRGGDGTETFNVHLAAGLAVTGSQVVIFGDDPTGDTGNRDAVHLIDGGGARAMTVTYQSPPGQALVEVDGGTPLELRFVETLTVPGDGGHDDTVTVVGSSGDDELAVVPTGAHSALVFTGGDPWDGPSEGDFLDQFPGVAGGGMGPDLNLGDVVAGGILVDAGAGGANTVYVHAPGETDLVHAPTYAAGVDPFGFGDGVIIPSAASLGLPDGYDAIDVSDLAVVIDNTGGGLLPVNLVTASLVQADPDDVGLVVNAGFEGNRPVADIITLTPSVNVVMQINGGDPDPATTGIVPPEGDRLAVMVPPGAEVDVYSDKLSPPSVVIDVDGVLPFHYSSIEGLWLVGATTVNLIGDNNHTVPQTDEFVVEGRGFQEAAIHVNGSGPIFVDGLQFLNVIGHDEIDTLEITPYADDTPRGWGVDVFYDEGAPTQADGAQSDLLVLHTSLLGGAVSEDIVIQPAGPESGEIVVTGAGFGTPIVDIDYVGNLDIIVLDDDGFASDTDTLTLRGTNPDNPATSGEERVTADLTAAGGVAGAKITVADADPVVPATPLLYRVRDFQGFASIRFELLGGDDSVDLTPGPVSVFLDGGDPSGAIQGTGDTLNVVTGGSSYQYFFGAEPNSGSFVVYDGSEAVRFDDVEQLQVDGERYLLPDEFEPNDTIATATVLGSLPKITLRDLTIHETQNDVTEDDYFQITAQDTGKLVIHVFFEHEYGDLDVEVRDAGGRFIAGSDSVTDDERIIIPVVSQEVYFLHVYSFGGDANAYDVEIENFAAPVPSGVTLDRGDDSGSSALDNVTNVRTPTFFLQADLLDFEAEFSLPADMVPSPSGSIDSDGATGADVDVLIYGVNTGTTVTGSATRIELVTWSLASPVPLPDDLYEVSARVAITDGQGTPVTGYTQYSAPLEVIVDATAPAAPAAPNLLTSSDTFDDVAGLLGPRWNSMDEVTAIDRPAFDGAAEPNAIVRVLANGVVVGEGTVSSAGAWEVTVEPLADGEYDITVQVEDLAGNVSAASAALPIVVDTRAPQRPTLDLAAALDSGSSDRDNVTGAPNDVSITVTAEDGSRVLLKDGGTVIDDFLMAGTTTTRPLTLSQGTHLLSAEAFDEPGNRSAPSEELVLVIDRTPPGDGGITVDLAPTSDTGVVGDNITSMSEPAFLGTAEANAKVRVFADDGVHGPVLVGDCAAGTDDTDGEPGNGVGLWEVTVEPLADGVYTITVEVEDLAGNVTAATDREVILVDPFEPNDGMDQATVLGSLSEVSLRGVKLHDTTDQDYFQVTAQGTGKLVISVFFEHARGNVDIAVRDASGNFIAESVSGANDNEHLVVPVVGQQQYFLHVVLVDDPDGLGNEYALEIENFAAPVPGAPQLDPNDDSGPSNADLVTLVDDARLWIVADLEEFVAGGLAPGINVLTAAEAGAGLTPGVAVQVFANGVSVGFADPLVGATLFEFTFDVTGGSDPLVGEWSRAIEIGPDGAPVASDALGYFNAITAAVRIFDGRGGELSPTPAQGRSPMSETLTVHFDPNTPDASLATLALATYGDTGDPGDFITRIHQPALVGVAEANTRLRVYAQRLDDAGNPIGAADLVGQTVVGSDTSDVGAAASGAAYRGEGGAPDDGLGLWEITVEPLADGHYRLTVEMEDVAGNSSDRADGPSVDLQIDTLPPQRPTIDLVDSDDTGSSDLDNVTIGDPGSLPAGGVADFRISAQPGTWVQVKDGEVVIAGFLFDATFDQTDGVLDGFGILTIDFFANQGALGIPSEGPHPLSAEAFDVAGNRSAQAEELLVTIDTTAPAAPSAPDLLAHSDSGSFDNDNVTNVSAPALYGTGEAGAIVRIWVSSAIAGGVPELVGEGVVGSDESDLVPTDGLGIWLVTIERLDDGVYDVVAQLEDLAGNLSLLSGSLRIEIDTHQPNTPFLDLVEASDSGRHNDDNVTNDDTPEVRLTTQDPNAALHLLVPDLAGGGVLTDYLRFRIYDRFEGTDEFLLYDSSLDVGADAVSQLGDGLTSLTAILEILPVQYFLQVGANAAVEADGTLADGIHHLKLEVEDRAGNTSEDFLLDLLIDTVAPPVSILGVDPAARVMGVETLMGTLDGSVSATSSDADLTGTWRLSANESAYPWLNWGQTQIFVYSQVPASGSQYLLKGSFYWFGIGYQNAAQTQILGTISGWEDFNGIYDASTNAFWAGGYQVRNVQTTGGLSGWQLYTSTYNAQVAPGGNQLTGGTWTGGGQWSATRSVSFGRGLGLPGVVTSDTDLGFLGRAEADAIVRLYVDPTADNLNDVPAEFSLTVALPEDGDDAFPEGQWATTFLRDLNDPAFFPLDGVREIVVTAEDLAGNVNRTDDGLGDAGQILELFVDTQGPRVTGVFITSDPEYDLFDPKPREDGPTPLVDQLSIRVLDPPDRSAVDPSFLYDALHEAIALEPGHYQLVGDAGGIIPIESVSLVPDPVLPGDPATGQIILTFFAPLADDRYTLTVSDGLVDPVGNALDGETGATQPRKTPHGESGDGVPGGDFVARFTVDSRPEIGVWSGGSVYIDTNGNFRFDPDNADYTNRDVAYTLGYASDDIFAGNFAAREDDPGTPNVDETEADGFDKLAAYGQNAAGRYRWLVDVDNDGVPDVDKVEPAGFNGLGAPVAGNFDVVDPSDPDDPGRLNGDEVGLFTGTSWLLDTDHDYLVSDETPIVSALRGYPIVGDFDGDGLDDLATFLKGVFYFDLAHNGLGGAADAEIHFDYADFSGVRQRPVAADMNQDGIDDLGIWAPDRGGATPEAAAGWYFLISNASLRQTGSVAPLDHPFEPVPFGNDLFARFGDDYAAPIVGNFDPPVAASTEPTAPTTQTIEGTHGNDTFELVVEGPGAWTVTVNGVPVAVAASVTTVDLDGLEGNDTVRLTGSAGKDTAALWPGHGTLSGDGYTVHVAGAEAITVYGGGGFDIAALHDDPDGVDTLQAGPTAAALSGEGYLNRVVSFAEVSAYATPGYADVAALHDDPTGKDTYQAWPDQAKIYGDGFYIRAVSFAYVHAFSTAGNEDMAVLHDDPNGTDTFKFWPDQAKLYGNGFFTRAKGFAQVHAFSSEGNDDLAVLYDNPDDVDTFKFYPGEAKLFGVGFYNRAKGFAQVHAFSTPGNNDVAILYDDPDGNEVFKAWPDQAKLYGDGFYNRAKGFRWVYAYARGGDDVAQLYGSDGQDRLVATSQQVKLFGSDFFNRASSFDRVYARGADDLDTAILYDAVLESAMTSILGDPASILWLYQFEQIQQRDTDDEDADSKTQAFDEAFMAYWL